MRERGAGQDETPGSHEGSDEGPHRLLDTATIDRVLLIASLLALLYVIIVCAWVSDDALISMRTLDHLTSGHGLRYNVAERVQAFTHPLWLLALLPLYLITGEALVGPIALGLVCTACAIGLAWWAMGRSPRAGWVLALALLGSKAFVDYSTSGLENPLTNLLLAGFAGLWLSGRVRGLAFVSALLLVNRMDTVLFVVPVWVLVVTEAKRRGDLLAVLRHGLVSAWPAVLWFGFSLIYYGSIWPNTAHAKLAAGVAQGDLVVQGLQYLRAGAHFDLASVVIVVAGVGLAVVGDRTVRALAAGVVLYLAYGVWIGGDFMVGRFMAAPVFMSALLLGTISHRVSGIGEDAEAGEPVGVAGIAWATVVIALAVSGVSTHSPLRASRGDVYQLGASEHEFAALGIVDERVYYYQHTGLFADQRELGLAPRIACEGGGGRVVLRTVCGDLGRVGYEACSEDHFIDPCGLADAFLARHPIQDPTRWRIGHFVRAVPSGYAESVASGRAELGDATLDAELSESFRVTRGPLFDARRLRVIVGRVLGRVPAQAHPLSSQ